MPDGELVTIGYAANNGHEYQSVAQELVRDGKIAADKLSLSAMIDYFKRYTNEIASYTQRNPRFVFFRMEEGPPRGSLNEPVTPMRSIATDKSIYPRDAEYCHRQVNLSAGLSGLHLHKTAPDDRRHYLPRPLRRVRTGPGYRRRHQGSRQVRCVHGPGRYGYYLFLKQPAQPGLSELPASR
jgi:hypothetical protein